MVRRRRSKKNRRLTEPQLVKQATARKSLWMRLRGLFFYVAIGAELIVPLIFYICLKYGDGSQRIISFIQGLMVWMTTPIFLWLVVDLFMRGFKE